MIDAAEDAQQGRLASTIRPEDADVFICGEVERNVFKHVMPLVLERVGFGEIADRDHANLTEPEVTSLRRYRRNSESPKATEISADPAR